MKAILIIFSLMTQNFVGAQLQAAEAEQVASKFSKATDVFGGYDGISGEAPIKNPLDSDEYNQNNLDLSAQIWADSEVSQKLCKSVGDQSPKSFSSWWEAVNKYVAAEKKRNAIVKVMQEELTNKIKSYSTGGQDHSTAQTDALRAQIEGINLLIDTLSGSNLNQSTGGANSVEISRLGSREELLAAVVQAQGDSLNEDKNYNDAYKSCLAGVEQSNSVASSACSTSTVGCARTKTVCSKDACSEVPDPVPGSCELKVVSCEMVNTDIPLFKKIPIMELKKLYEMAPVPSKDISVRLLRIIVVMRKQVTIFFPKSTDASYDWLTPLHACLTPMEKVVKANGIICPADAKAGKDYELDTFQYMGKSDDFWAEREHYTVGVPNTDRAPAYLDSQNAYANIMKNLVANPDNKNKTPEEIEALALREIWASYSIQSKYSQNFVEGKDINDGIDQKAAQAYAEEVLRRNKVTEWTCNPDTCKPPVVVVPVSRIEIPPYARVTSSAKTFLDAVGIKDSLGEEVGIYLSDKWNKSDLSIGQSHHRQFYFKHIEELIKPLLASDSSTLAELLIQRQKLIDNYNSFIASLSDGNVLEKSTVVTDYGGTTTTVDKTHVTPKTINTTAVDQTGIKNQVNSNSGVVNPADFLGKASGGLIYYSKIGSLSDGVNAANGLSGGLSAISYSKNVNDKLKKSTDKISNLQKRKSKAELSEEAKKLAAFSKRMKLKNINSKSLANVASLLSSGQSKSNTDSAINAKDESKDSGSSFYGSESYGDLNGTGAGLRSGATSSSSKNSNSGNSKNYYASSGAAGTSGSSYQPKHNADQQKLLDAIGAKNSKNASQYESEDSDSLFSRVTKAYIRSYEKLK